MLLSTKGKKALHPSSDRSLATLVHNGTVTALYTHHTKCGRYNRPAVLRMAYLEPSDWPKMRLNPCRSQRCMCRCHRLLWSHQWSSEWPPRCHCGTRENTPDIRKAQNLQVPALPPSPSMKCSPIDYVPKVSEERDGLENSACSVTELLDQPRP